MESLIYLLKKQIHFKKRVIKKIIINFLFYIWLCCHIKTNLNFLYLMHIEKKFLSHTNKESLS